MIITICLLILIYSILKRPVDGLLEKLEDVDWKTLAQDAWDKIVTYSKKLGRATTRELLKFYYVMSEGNLSTFEKALVYAGIIYISLFQVIFCRGRYLDSWAFSMMPELLHGSTARSAAKSHQTSNLKLI